MLKHTQPRLSQLASAVAVVLGGITLLPAAHAAAPAAGVSISNIASASYNDNTGNPQTVTSNEVRTTVLKVASFTLVANRTALASANSTVNLSHTLTNTGNGTDTFTINLANLSGTSVDDIDLSNIAVYIDANGDGTADNTTNLMTKTVTLPAGQSVNLIVVGTTPLSALALQTAKLTISATTTTDLAPSYVLAGGTATASNTDTVTITAGAAIAVVKSASIAQITPTGTRTIKYTLRYTNSGNTAATEVAIKDQLPANVSYVPNSARWSTTGNTALTASADGDILEITPAVGSVTDLLTFTIGSVPANSTGTVTFDVTVNAGAPVGDIINIGKFSYDPDTTGAGESPVTDVPTNSVPVEVLANRIGTINDSLNDAYSDTQRNPADPLKDDTQTIPSIAQGATADFTAYVHNTGNLAQVFEVLLPTIPTGATVQLFKADGVTPLTNISGTSAVDVGPIPAGGTLAVRVLVKLPNNVSGNNNGNGFVTEVRVQPVGAITTDSTTLIIGNVVAARADLHNGTADNDLATSNVGTGEGVTGATVIDTKSTTPGNSVTFNLGVFNGSTTSDNFNLSVGGLPAGWTVVFLDASNNAVTNTGNITTATQSNFTAVVTPPVGTSVNDYPLDFVITSPVSGLTDTMRDVVKVTEFRQLSLVPNRQGQVAPGGTILYSHTLTNNGNIVEGAAAGQLTLNLVQASGTGTFAGNVTIAVDLNNNGLIDANETLTGLDLNQRLPAGLAKGGSATILVQVQAPAQALPGQIDSSTVKITANNAVNGVAAPASVQIIDTTTVTSGQIRLVKTQAVDALCDGIADGPYGQGVIAAKPGECVVYRIVATNEGNAAVSSVVITDATPAFTTISTVATNTPAVSGNITSPAVGATGTVTDNVGSLAPAATAQVDFGVKIDE